MDEGSSEKGQQSGGAETRDKHLEQEVSADGGWRWGGVEGGELGRWVFVDW